MQWLEITLSVAPGAVEEVAQALTETGFADLVLEDQAELEDFLEENRNYWDYIDESLQQHLQGLSAIRLYLEETDGEGLAKLQALAEGLKPKVQNVQVQSLPETDWSESWKDSYPPQQIGKRLVVLPYWLCGQEADRLPVILDPGLTFGTGAHPSTQMVMEEMEEMVVSGDHCLDLGSGSGILSIAALRLGAESAIGVDIDPKAEDIARQNAAYNGFAAPEFTAYTGNVTADKALMSRLKERKYDVVLVNIVADVIIGLAPMLPMFLEADSTLICSGILDSRLGEVTAALTRAGLEITRIREKEEWRCVCAKRRTV